MSNLTRSNIAYDFNISPHKLNLQYGDDVITYVFSSDLYRIKFLNKLEENRNKINSSLSKRFNFNIQNDLLSDLKLYITIEKRGFLIFLNGVKIECLKSITLNGQKMIQRN